MNKCNCGREIKGSLPACATCYGDIDALYRIAHNLSRIEEHMDKLTKKGIICNVLR